MVYRRKTKTRMGPQAQGKPDLSIIAKVAAARAQDGGKQAGESDAVAGWLLLPGADGALGFGEVAAVDAVVVVAGADASEALVVEAGVAKGEL